MNRYFLRPPKSEDEPAQGEVAPQETTLSDIKKVNARRHEVLDFMLLRMTPEEIAEEMDQPVDIITRDIEAIEEKGWESKEEELETIRKEAVAKLRYTFDRARKAFDLSQGTVETITTDYGKGGEGENGTGQIKTQKVKTEKKAGDAKMLQVMNDSVEKMAKVTGAQKHKEVEINQNVDNRSVNFFAPDRARLPKEYNKFTKKPADQLTPDERRAAGLDKIDTED